MQDFFVEFDRLIAFTVPFQVKLLQTVDFFNLRVKANLCSSDKSPAEQTSLKLRPIWSSSLVTYDCLIEDRSLVKIPVSSCLGNPPVQHPQASDNATHFKTWRNLPWPTSAFHHSSDHWSDTWGWISSKTLPPPAPYFHLLSCCVAAAQDVEQVGGSIPDTNPKFLPDA